MLIFNLELLAVKASVVAAKNGVAYEKAVRTMDSLRFEEELLARHFQQARVNYTTVTNHCQHTKSLFGRPTDNATYVFARRSGSFENTTLLGSFSLFRELNEIPRACHPDHS